MKTRSQIGRSNVTKGKAFERWVVNQLQAAGIACERNIAQSRSAKREGCDVEGTDWWIECGYGKTIDPRSKYAQASSDWYAAADDLRPIVVVTKRPHCEPQATMALAEAATLYVGPMGRSSDGPLVTMRFVDWLEWVKP